MRGYKMTGGPGAGVIALAAVLVIFAVGTSAGAFVLAPLLRTEANAESESGGDAIGAPPATAQTDKADITGAFESAFKDSEPASPDGGGAPESSDGSTQSGAEQPVADTGVSDSPAASASSGDTGGGTARPTALHILGHMSLREKVCQMFIVFPDVLTGVVGTEVAGDRTRAALGEYPVGGLILMSQNIKSGEQITAFNKTVQTYSELPLFLAVDEEGGQVARLGKSLGAHSVGPMFSYRNDGVDTAFANAVTLARTLKDHGFNLDFAPVADVLSNPENTVIGDRAYSDDFTTAAGLVSAAVRGFRSENIICVLKHFPGHGDTAEDSHYGAAYARKPLGELRKSEFLPFSAGIRAGADMVMLGHIVIPDVDALPATISREIASGILREQLGYRGIIVTDALNMRALTANYDSGEIAVSAVNAGVDILLGPSELDISVAAIIAAVESGEIPEERIDASVRRILDLKISKGLIGEQS